jgi:ribosomal protein S18 acetylase RimI-like enzyme
MPVGYLLGVYVFSLEHLGLTAEIDEFFVMPQQRGHGIGLQLLKIAEAVFVQAGCTNVSLQLSRRNDSARAFYRRQGYTERSGYELLDKMLRDG